MVKRLIYEIYDTVLTKNGKHVKIHTIRDGKYIADEVGKRFDETRTYDDFLHLTDEDIEHERIEDSTGNDVYTM